jgi:hypothetical protein
MTSCGFSSDDELSDVDDSISNTLKLNPADDSDGDLISNGDELKLGRNPLVADLPDLRFQFMRDFTLQGEFESKSIEINSLRDIRSNDYEYRVGEITLWDIVRKTTSKFARYEGVVEGEFKDIDLTRISYPHISPQFIAKVNIDHQLSAFKSAKVKFTNTLKLKRNQGFQKIVNPTFNFRFKNYETSEYEQIGQQKVEGNIFEGVLEKFDVELTGLPERLISENFYQKGEFITAEIDDYEMPSLKTTYKKLMASVLDKSIPVTIITPLETKIYYVSLQSGHNKLGNFLKSIYKNNFKIEDNKLIQVGGMANNLPSYEYLSELKSITKKGKWFILFNNTINDDIFQYEFKKGDKVVLNYMTGKSLSDQSYHKEIRSLSKFESAKDKIDLNIGEIGQNDELQITLSANHIRYEHFATGSFNINDSGGHASWVFHDYRVRSDEYSFTDSEIQKRVSFILNGKEYPLNKLLDEEKVIVSFDGKLIKLNISSAAKTFDLTLDDTYSLLLRVYPNNYDADIGLWITGLGGWIGGLPGCNSADAICKGWYNTSGIPLGKVCNHIQPSLTNECSGVLKSEYRKRRQTLRRDLNFDASFLLINKFN